MGEKSKDEVVLQGRWAAKVDLMEGGAVRIRKCRVKDIRMVTAFIAVVAAELKLDTTGKIGVALQDASVMLNLVTTCAEQVYTVIASMTDKEQDFIEDLDIDEGLKVAIAVYELNKSFFVDQVYPLLAPLQELLKQPNDKPTLEQKKGTE